MAAPSFAPRVLVIEPDQWPRALLRAALREQGYDAVGFRRLDSAIRMSGREHGRGSVGAVVIDSDAFLGAALEDRQRLWNAFPLAALILIRRPTRGTSVGEWAGVLTRPVSVEDIVKEVQRHLPPGPAPVVDGD